MDKQIKHIHYDHAKNGGERRTDGSEEERAELEEHIIRAYLGKIHKICNHRHAERGNCGEYKIDRLFCPLVRVIARSEHYESAEDHSSVIEEGMESRKGNAGISSEDGGRVDEVDRSAEQPKGANVAAAYVSYFAAPKNGKGHSVHEDAAGVEGKHAADFKVDRGARVGLPNYFYDLEANEGSPNYAECRADGLLTLFCHKQSKNNDHR